MTERKVTCESCP